MDIIEPIFYCIFSVFCQSSESPVKTKSIFRENRIYLQRIFSLTGISATVTPR